MRRLVAFILSASVLTACDPGESQTAVSLEARIPIEGYAVFN